MRQFFITLILTAVGVLIGLLAQRYSQPSVHSSLQKPLRWLQPFTQKQSQPHLHFRTSPAQL